MSESSKAGLKDTPSSDLKTLSNMVDEWIERKRKAKKRADFRTGLKDVRVSSPLEFKCYFADGNVVSYRTDNQAETGQWLGKLVGFVDSGAGGEASALSDSEEGVASSNGGRCDIEDCGENTVEDRKCQDVAGAGATGADGGGSNRRQQHRPRSMRATHSLDDLRHMIQDWERKRSEDPHFRANIDDISMTSPFTFTISFVSTRGEKERRIYRTKSKKATEEWIENLSGYTETSLRMLLLSGARPPEWVPDEKRDNCSICKAEFTFFFRRKHHCRACGEVVCHECASTFLTIPWIGIEDQVRVCDFCVKHWGEMLVFWHSKAARSSVSSTATRESRASPQLVQNARLSDMPRLEM
eukprot:g2762.t1